MRLVQEYTADIEHRFKYAMIAALLLFAVVSARLFYLQVMRGSFYHFFSTENSIKEIRVHAVRGMIFDRRGQVLVDYTPDALREKEGGTLTEIFRKLTTRHAAAQGGEA